MKLLSVFLLATAGTALAKGGNSTSTKSQCKQVEKLTKLVNLASNTTRLDDQTHGNATKVTAIQAKASSAAAALQTLQANTTLMAACAQVFAVQDMMQSCAQMSSLEGLAALAGNATALEHKFKNNTAKAEAIKTKAAASVDKLAALQSNATLTQFCAVREAEQACNVMSQLQKEVDRAANATAVQAKADGNSTKAEKAQARASRAAAKLKVMQSNETLTGFCSSTGSEASTEAATSTSSSSGSSTSSSGSNKSSAQTIRPGSSMAGVLALLLAPVYFL